jgi:hypothetical protein
MVAACRLFISDADPPVIRSVALLPALSLFSRPLATRLHASMRVLTLPRCALATPSLPRRPSRKHGGHICNLLACAIWMRACVCTFACLCLCRLCAHADCPRCCLSCHPHRCARRVSGSSPCRRPLVARISAHPPCAVSHGMACHCVLCAVCSVQWHRPLLPRHPSRPLPSRCRLSLCTNAHARPCPHPSPSPTRLGSVHTALFDSISFRFVLFRVQLELYVTLAEH